MFRLPTLAVALVVAVSGTHAAKKPCPGYDVCGWQLTSTYGYDVADIQNAASDAGQDVGIAWDSIYSCSDGGSIEWSVHCGGGGTCNPGATDQVNSACRDDASSGGQDQQGQDQGDQDQGQQDQGQQDQGQEQEPEQEVADAPIQDEQQQKRGMAFQA